MGVMHAHATRVPVSLAQVFVLASSLLVSQQ
jgi:hypothetical protein